MSMNKTAWALLGLSLSGISKGLDFWLVAGSATAAYASIKVPLWLGKKGYQWWTADRDYRPAKTKAVRPPKPVPPPSIAELTKKARADYDTEVRAIKGMELDTNEEKVTLDQARQRLMRRLKGLLP